MFQRNQKDLIRVYILSVRHLNYPLYNLMNMLMRSVHIPLP